MGYLSPADIQDALNKYPNKPLAPVPAKPAPANSNPIASAEEKGIGFVDAAEGAARTRTLNTVHALGVNDGISTEQQTAKYGGPVGSTAYYNFVSKHPYSHNIGPEVARGFGLEMPPQEEWDKMNFAEKAITFNSLAGKALAKMVIKAPREIIKAPIRFGYSVGDLITSPWKQLASGDPKAVDRLNNPKDSGSFVLPWLGEISTYWKGANQGVVQAENKPSISDIKEHPVKSTLGLFWEGLKKVGAPALAQSAGDATILAPLAEAGLAAFRPRSALKTGEGVTNVEPIKAVLDAGKKVDAAPGALGDYYSLPKQLAKKYGGNETNTFWKVTPAGLDGKVEISIVQRRGGILNKVSDKLTGNAAQVYEGKFGPETKIHSQVLDGGQTEFSGAKPPESIPGENPSMVAPAGEATEPAILPAPLKGFENKPITSEQFDNLRRISEINKMPPGMAEAAIKVVTKKGSLADLTQGDYVAASQALGALKNTGVMALGDKTFAPNVFSQWLSPVRHWTRDFERSSGLPVYSKIVDPIERGFMLSEAAKGASIKTHADLFGEYQGPKFTEERRLVMRYLEGDNAAIASNESLTPKAKADLIDIAEKARPILDEYGKKLGPEFIKGGKNYRENYISHIQDIGGTFQRYKEGAEIPKSITSFAERERTGTLMGPIVDDAQAVMDIYANSVARKQFLDSAFQQAHEVMPSLPETVKGSMKSYILEKLGFADRLEQAMNESSIKIASKLGINLPADAMRKAVQLALDTTYAATIGGRPGAVVRNLLQLPTLGYARLGPKFFAQGFAKALTPEGIAELKAGGFLIDRGVPFGADLAAEATAGGKAYSGYRGLTQGLMSPYSGVDAITRGSVYWQGKYIWEDALSKYNSGKLTWKQAEQAMDLGAFHQVDQNLIRTKIANGDTEGAFHTYVRDLLDETNFPYRKGSSNRVSYGTTGKLLTQFSQWPLEYVHTLSRWMGSGQFNKIIRLAGASVALKRTIQDTTGLDITNWLGGQSLKPTPSVITQFATSLAGLLTNLSNNDEFNKKSDDIINQLKSAGIPAGVEAQKVSAFWKSINQSRKDKLPPGQYGVYDKAGRLRYQTDFKDIFWTMLGFPTSQSVEQSNLTNDIRNAQTDRAAAKKKVMQLYQKGQYDEANKIISEKGIIVNPSDFDAYYIPLNQRTFKALPPSLQSEFAPRVFK